MVDVVDIEKTNSIVNLSNESRQRVRYVEGDLFALVDQVTRRSKGWDQEAELQGGLQRVAKSHKGITTGYKELQSNKKKAAELIESLVGIITIVLPK